MNVARALHVALLSAGVVVVLLGCDGLNNGSSGPGAGYQAERVRVSVSLDKTPLLYEPFKLTATLIAHEPLDGPVEAWLTLPPSVAFINGDTKWQGHLSENAPQTFEATLAFVLEGQSRIGARARFPAKSKEIYQTEVTGGYTWLRVGANMSELKPGGPGRDEASWVPQDQFPSSSASLSNTTDEPRLFVASGRAGLEQIIEEGLISEERSVPFRGKSPNFTGLLDSDYGDRGFFLVLFDQRRATTGYHLAAVRLQQAQGVPVSSLADIPKNVTSTLVLNLVLIEPKDSWPIENREISAFQIIFVGSAYYDQARSIELVVKINGEQVTEFRLGRREEIQGEPLELDFSPAKQVSPHHPSQPLHLDFATAEGVKPL